MSITHFFQQIGFPLKNIRWSWGARNGDAVVLRTWSDQFVFKTRRVIVLREPFAYRRAENSGLNERVEHVKALWEGGVAGYTVIATSIPGEEPRTIKDFRSDAVFAIDRLELREDGVIDAVLGELVAAEALADHAKTHKTTAAVGDFPVESRQA